MGAGKFKKLFAALRRQKHLCARHGFPNWRGAKSFAAARDSGSPCVMLAPDEQSSNDRSHEDEAPIRLPPGPGTARRRRGFSARRGAAQGTPPQLWPSVGLGAGTGGGEKLFHRAAP